MKEKNYLKKIYELLNKDDLTQKDIFESFDFYEREELVFGINTGTMRDLIQKCNDSNIYLFSDEEFLRMQNSGSNLVSSNILLPKEIFLEGLKRDFYSVNIYNNKNFDLLNDNEKKDLIEKTLDYQNDSNFYRFQEIFSMIDSDEIKDELLGRIVSDKLLKKYFKYAMSSLVTNFKDDKLKLKYLHFVKRDNQASVIKTFNDDHKKIIHSLSLDSASREEILLSLNEQEFIKKLLLMPMMSKMVITRIKDEKLREKYFRRLFTMIKSEDKGLIVASFSTREKQLELSKLLTTEISKYQFINNSNVLTDGDIWRIAKSFRSDERIMEAAYRIKDKRIKRELYERINSTKVISESLSLINDPSSFDLLADKLSERELKKIYFNFYNMNPYYKLKILSKIKDKKWIIKQMQTIDLTDCASYDVDYFCDIYAKVYKLNKEHLKEMANNFGYGIFKYIQSDKIKTAINQDDDSFKKYMQLFNKNNFISDEKSVKNLLFAFSQQEYKEMYADVINIFANILHKIEDGDYFEAEELIEKTIREVEISNDELVKLFGIPVDSEKKYSRLIIEKILAGNNEKTLASLHLLVDRAIDSHRNRVTANMTNNKFNSIPHVISEKALMDYYIYAVPIEHLKFWFNRFDMFFTDEEKKFMNDSLRLNAVVEFKREPNNAKMTELLKKDLRLFGVIIRKIHQFAKRDENISYFANYFPNIEKKVDYDNSRNYEFIFSLLQQIDSNQLKISVFNNPEKFSQLSDFVAKNKIMGSTHLLRNVSEKAGISIEESLIANLVNNFSAITKNLEKKTDKRIGVIDYLVEADYFNSESFRYENLFGRDVFRLIKNNPGPNSASISRKERLYIATDLVKKIYARKYIPIPSQDKDYTISNGKTLNVTIGDLTNLNNLTYGERTGACMRIGGAGSTLFNFCLLEDNGFHIVFNNPKTGNFVSRVSGFRNGNTVFLNELRYSVDEGYSNEDLVECLKLVSDEIIKQTKNSQEPVNNVVISPYYAMSPLGSEVVNLGASDIKKGLSNFYTDVSEEAIVLSTTSKSAKFSPVILSSKTPKYEGIIPKTRYYEGHLAMREIAHLRTLEQFLSGKDIDAIDVKNEDVLACYATSTWGVYINSKHEIKTVVVSSKKESLEGMQRALDDMKSKLASLEGTNAKNR